MSRAVKSEMLLCVQATIFACGGFMDACRGHGTPGQSRRTPPITAVASQSITSSPNSPRLVPLGQLTPPCGV